MRKQWRCFHCDQVFRSPNEAAIHFGGGAFEEAGCVLKDYEEGLLGIIRQQQAELERFRERFRAEDSDLLRVIATMEADHRQNQSKEAAMAFHGCICPPGSEKTCHGLSCPRRSFSPGAATGGSALCGTSIPLPGVEN